MNRKLERLFGEIKPEVTVFCQEVKDYFCTLLSRIKDVRSVELLGSVSRGTYIKEPKDFDFFLFYDDLSSFNLADFRIDVEALLQGFQDKLVLNLIHLQAKHRGFPYLKVLLQFKNKKIDLDLIPSLKEPREMGCIDRTKKHDDYMNARLSEAHKIEIRKLKYLLKRNNLYGAQSHIQGISGYACEVLIQKYGTIAEIACPLYELYDPVDPSRNLLAPMSQETLRRFNFLKTYNFKNPNRYKPNPDSHLYYWEKAPLRVFSTLKKHKNVLSAVYISGTIYLEVMPYYTRVERNIPYDSPFFLEQKEGKAVYLSSKKYGYKKHHFCTFLSSYPQLKKVEITDTKKLKTYHFFK